MVYNLLGYNKLHQAILYIQHLVSNAVAQTLLPYQETLIIASCANSQLNWANLSAWKLKS